jgi:hypothetical protein
VRSRTIALIALSLFFVVPPAARAQSSARLSVAATNPSGASLSGVVTSQTGAALRDVTVTIKNLDTRETRTIPTDAGGRYQTSGLPAGRFEIRATKSGFGAETRAGISLAADQGATVDI